jgi:peptidoglycan DL-endopeptidase CwlO
VVDVMPSSGLDDLFGTAAPSAAVPADAPIGQQVGQQKFLTRRELRAAEAAGTDVTASLPDFSAAGIEISAATIHDAALRQDAPSRRSRDRAATRARATRKLRRAEVRRIHAGTAAPKSARKNPVSVLATMAVVGGLFAVAGLPAYAITDDGETDGAKLTAASQSVTVSGEAGPVAAVRDGYEATTPEEIAAATRDDVRAANNEKYLASGARELGDDYPWPYELGEEQGGGLSVLNYYYRQCTDFVAWRINRDAGSFKAPYKWVWSNLTPTGGNASQWKYSWEKKGWPVSNTPTVGDVAWFGSTNHVAYVKQVLDNGFIVIEEYNYVQSVYGQRTILASTVEAFLGKPS